MRPVLEDAPGAHCWSIGASDGTHAVRLDTLDEGQTRLLACTPSGVAAAGYTCMRVALPL